MSTQQQQSSLALVNDSDELRSLNAVANRQLNSAKMPFTKYR